MEAQRPWGTNPGPPAAMVAEKDGMRMEWKIIPIPQQKIHLPQ